MKGLRVDVKRMLKDAQVKTVCSLSEQLAISGVSVSSRTLFRWQRGTGFSSPKFMEVTEALGYDDPVILLTTGEITD